MGLVKGAAKLLRRAGDLIEGWHREGTNTNGTWSYLRRVQFRSMEDLRSVVKVLESGGGAVRTFLGQHVISLDALEKLADSELDEIWVMAFEEDPGERPMLDGYAWVRIANPAARVDGTIPTPFLSVHVSPPPAGKMRYLKTDQLAKVALGAVERKRRWFILKRDYPAISTITKPTLQQRDHDRKVRWQAAGISFLGTIVTTVLLRIFFPEAGGIG